MEASFLTSLGGVLGIALGSGIGLVVHLVSGFPVSLPWWSFAIGPRVFGRGRPVFSACIPRSRPPASIPSKRSVTNN